MFETVTYEKILKRMLDRVPDSFDKREGSIIFDALAPAAVELQLMYIDLDTFLKEAFADTASREYLIRRAAERAISPHPAEAAVWKGVFEPVTLDIRAGERFNYKELNFYVADKRKDGEYRLICETAGLSGNSCYGNLVPIGYVEGLKSARLTELLKAGSDEEATEDFRDRYLTAIRKPSTSGNVHDYYNWAMACSGVGAVRIFPLAFGPGSVKVVIAGENRGEAGAEVISLVKEYVESKRPIGADVTVSSASELPVNVVASAKIKNGLKLGEVQNEFQKVLAAFLYDHAFELTYIGIARVGNLLLETPGVEDYTGLLLNGSDANLILKDEEIAVAGAVTLEVIP